MTRVHRPETEARFVEANGLRFGYLSWGEGAPVLAMHGFPDSAHSWAELGGALASRGYQVIAPFSRGYAPTALPTRDTDGETLGRDLVALARVFGDGKPLRVVGHDWGAEAVLAAVSMEPSLFSQAVTVAIPHRGALFPTPRLAWALRHFISLTLPGAEARFAADDLAQIEVLYGRWSPAWRPSKSDLETVKNVFAAEGVVHAALGYYRAASVRLPSYLRVPVRVPMLAVAGAEDMAGPELFERVRGMYEARYEVVAIGGGHFCHRESPGPFADAVVRFFDSV